MDPIAPPPAPSQEWLAYTALALGVLSCAFGCMTGIPAIVVGAVALKQVAQGMRPLAIVGIVLGSLSTLASLAALVAMLLGVSVLGAMMDDIDHGDFDQQQLGDTD